MSGLGRIQFNSRQTENYFQLTQSFFVYANPLHFLSSPSSFVSLHIFLHQLQRRLLLLGEINFSIRIPFSLLFCVHPSCKHKRTISNFFPHKPGILTDCMCFVRLESDGRKSFFISRRIFLKKKEEYPPNQIKVERHSKVLFHHHHHFKQIYCSFKRYSLRANQSSRSN